MTSFATSVFTDCSITLDDLARQQFDAFPGVEQQGEIQGHLYWSKRIVMGRTILHLHTDEPPIRPTLPFQGIANQVTRND